MKKLWILLANYSIFVFLAIGIWVGLMPGGLVYIFLSLLAVIIGRGVFCKLFYILYPKRRPYQSGALEPPFSIFFSWKKLSADSFPSGHVTSLVGISVVFGSFNVWVGLLCFVIALITGIARVRLKYHYPVDVFGGVILGIFTGFVVLYLGKVMHLY